MKKLILSIIICLLPVLVFGNCGKFEHKGHKYINRTVIVNHITGYRVYSEDRIIVYFGGSNSLTFIFNDKKEKDEYLKDLDYKTSKCKFK